MSKWTWGFGLALVAVATALVLRNPHTRSEGSGDERSPGQGTARPPRWQGAAATADARFDSFKRRVLEKYGIDRPGHIEAFRGYADAEACEIMGRVLADPPPAVPDSEGSRWTNLREQWARFESDEVPGVTVEVSCNGQVLRTVTDGEGYYRVRIPMTPPKTRSLWLQGQVSIPGSTLTATHDILAVSDEADFGIISDIDDTVLDSKVVDWKAAAKLTFLHNVRTRKPLPGVSQLYRSLQQGRSEVPVNPLFYVSSSPWNLYDLLESFLSINEIPPGPILLRDLGVEPEYFIKSKGHGHKLDNVRKLFGRYPTLGWVLVGDSGQADAEIYTAAAQEFPGRVLAIYIRDVDPDSDSIYDRGVDDVFRKTVADDVPMLRVKDSDAIAKHLRSIGLLPPEEVAAVTKDVARDKAAPPQVES